MTPGSDTSAFLRAIETVGDKVDALRVENSREHSDLHDRITAAVERVTRLEACSETRRLLWTPFYAAAAALIAGAIMTGVVFLLRLWAKGT
jgi:hypothetical protein